MSSNKKILFLAIMLLVLPLAKANFEFYAGSSPDEICPGSTGLFTDVVQNTGAEPLSFTLSTSGTASAFSTAVPMGFTLSPDQIKTIFTYISPRSTTNVGTYSLDVVATANGQSEEINHDVLVRDCYEYVLVALNEEKHACPCGTEKFDFELTNNGQYTESYTLSVEGEYTSNVVLSTNQLTLDSGESELIYAYITTACSDLGEYGFTVKATPQNSNSIRTATSTMVVDACYDFDIQTERDLVNMCEHTQETLPITVENTGSTNNEFTLDLDGPLWANLEKTTLTVAPNSVKTTNLVLNPDYGVEGSFEIEFSAEPEMGDVKAYSVFNVNVKKCHGVSVDIEKSLDRICNSLENTYNVNVRNVGEYSKEYYFNVDGPDWATLDRTSATLDVGEETQLTLTVNPPYDTSEASYMMTVQATAKDSNKVANSDILEIETVAKDQCYQAFLGMEETEVEVYYDSSATTPVVIENKGTYTTTYDLSLSGTASSFTYLNPSSVTIDAGKSEVVYLYVAPSGQIANGDYSVTVSARLGDSSILASEKVNIKVSESAYLDQDETQEVQESGESFFSRLKAFVMGFFKSEVVEEETFEEDEQLLEDLEGDLEETDETEGELEELEGDLEEEEETVELEELTLIATKLTEGELEEFMLNEELHTIELTTAEDNSVWLTISSDPILLNLEEGETQKLDLDEDGFYDLQVTFTGYVEGEADITYEKIYESVEEVVVEEDSGEETEELEGETLEVITTEAVSDQPEDGETNGFFTEFFASLSTIWTSVLTFKYHILGAVAIVLVLYIFFKSKAPKKLIEFFEEEIEEEDVPVLGEKKEEDKKEDKKEEKKEESPKKEEKKEEKKTTAKKTTKKKEVTEDTEDQLEIKGLDEESDKEDFIIEFDDDEAK
jgi:uncharacterized membrane protein